MPTTPRSRQPPAADDQDSQQLLNSPARDPVRNGDTEFAASPKSPATFSKSSATHSKPQRRPDRDVKLVTHSFVTALLGVTIGALLVILFKPGNKPAACRRFVTEECFWDSNSDEPLVTPACGKLPECPFDAAAQQCPFAAAGRHETVPASHCDSGGEGSGVYEKRRLLPACKGRCCTGDAPGEFVRPEGDAKRRIWQAVPSADCSYFQYASGEVLEGLTAAGVRVVVTGDSMMHQLWTRLVALLREQRPVIDYRIFTHARYSVCRESDVLTIERDGYDAQIRGVIVSVQRALVAPFFGRLGRRPRWPRRCKQAPFTTDLIHAPGFEAQRSHLEAYLSTMLPGERMVLVAGVGNFEKGREVPPDYLAYLERLAARGVDLIYVGVATKSADNHPEFVQAYQARNKVMREWAAEQRRATPEKAPYPAFVDFDAMSRDPLAPDLLLHDIHYQCYTRYTKSAAKYADVNLLRDRRHGTPVPSLQVGADASCDDDMNRGLWQVIFNIVLGGEHFRSRSHLTTDAAAPAPQ